MPDEIPVDLAAIVGRADHIIVTLPGTAQTTKLVNADVLARAKATSVEIAINKAFTAACHRRPTHTYTNAQSGGEAFGIMNMHGGRFAIFVGGWPIEVDGEVVGGIGVSGGHTREDIACCKAGTVCSPSRMRCCQPASTSCHSRQASRKLGATALSSPTRRSA